MPFEIIAPAKVNLFLHVTGRRDNGYHELESLFAFTKQGDLLIIEECEQLTLEITGPFSHQLAQENAQSNLVYRAALALQRHFDHNKGAHITLLKNLPVASGVGGGSSDAAAALKGLADFWRLDATDEDLETLAVPLGADVLPCLSHRPQWITGIGEISRFVDINYPHYILLVNPGLSISTPSIFDVYQEMKIPFDALISDPDPISQDVTVLTKKTCNRLTEAAIACAPEVADVLASLRQEKAAKFVAMSGSGATCMALFNDEMSVMAAQARINEMHGNWWTMASELICQ